MPSPTSQPAKVSSDKPKRRKSSALDGSEQPDERPTAKPASAAKSNKEMKPPSYIPSSTTTKRHRGDDNNSASPKVPKSHRGSLDSSSRPPNSKPATSSPPAQKSPGSVRSIRKPKLTSTAPKRDASPETDFNDGASVAGSTTSLGGNTRIRRTESERIEYFKNQPECGEFESHRALCTRCEKWVNLGKAQTYTVRPWEHHRAKCDEKVFETSVPDQPTSVATTSTEIAPSEPKRKELLDSDSRADSVEPNRILCKKCRRWVKSTEKYDISKWHKHLDKCTGQIPSVRVATAERKIQIHNDPVATSLGPKQVKCNGCDKVVDLDGDEEYSLASWDAHKAECHKAQALLKLKLRSRSSVRPSPSAASTEGSTAVAESSNKPSSSPSSRRGVKRRREESAEPNPPEPESTVDSPPLENTMPSDERPRKMPRNESYVPPAAEAPGPFGWFMMPFHAFLKGFKESMNTATR